MADLDPFSPQFRADPYPAYAALRDEEPVHWSDRLRSWVLTGYDEVQTFFRDPRFSADRSRVDRDGTRGGEPVRREVRSIGSDPPEHTAVRALAARAFTPRQVESLRPRVSVIVGELLARLDGRDTFDLIEDFAYPLPITVISEMFGVPEKDRPRVQEWSRDMARSMDHMYSRRGDGGGGAALGQYFVGLAAQRTAEPRQDLISKMLEVEEGGDALTVAEVISLCAVLVFAGHETTTNLIGNGVLALLRDPAQRGRVQSGDVPVATAVEELLRYDSPAQMISRVVAEDIELDRHMLARGQNVLAVLGAANRDPSQFDDADRLDVGRDPNPHIAFGHGIHFCLGAMLSRREAQTALPALFDRFPRLRLAGEPVWRDTFVLRGLESLRVATT